MSRKRDGIKYSYSRRDLVYKAEYTYQNLVIWFKTANKVDLSRIIPVFARCSIAIQDIIEQSQGLDTRVQVTVPEQFSRNIDAWYRLLTIRSQKIELQYATNTLDYHLCSQLDAMLVIDVRLSRKYERDTHHVAETQPEPVTAVVKSELSQPALGVGVVSLDSGSSDDSFHNQTACEEISDYRKAIENPISVIDELSPDCIISEEVIEIKAPRVYHTPVVRYEHELRALGEENHVEDQITEPLFPHPNVGVELNNPRTFARKDVRIVSARYAWENRHHLLNHSFLAWFSCRFRSLNSWIRSQAFTTSANARADPSRSDPGGCES